MWNAGIIHAQFHILQVGIILISGPSTSCRMLRELHQFQLSITIENESFVMDKRANTAQSPSFTVVSTHYFTSVMNWIQYYVLQSFIVLNGRFLKTLTSRGLPVQMEFLLGCLRKLYYSWIGLTRLFNQSIQSSELSPAWKFSCILPILKGLKSELSN